MGFSPRKRQERTTKSSPTATTTKRKDVWTTLLQISVWHALAEGRLHHRPHRAHHHRHRDHRQRRQVLTVRERGGLRGQRRLHRPHHQVLCLRRLFWHPLLRSFVHRSKNETPVPSSSGFSSLSAAASSTSTSSSSAIGRAWRTGCPSPTWSSTPRSPWWSSPSPRSAYHQRRCCPRLWCSTSLQGL